MANLISTTDSRGTTSYTFDAAGTPTSLNYDTDLNGYLDPETLTFATDAEDRRTDEWLNASSSNTVWDAHVHTTYDTSGHAGLAAQHRLSKKDARRGGTDGANPTDPSWLGPRHYFSLPRRFRGSLRRC